MAKKAKKSKFSDEDKTRIEQRFRRVRDEALRKWYEEAQSDDVQVRAVAQARLQLQLALREKRREVALRKQERDACKNSGDENGLKVARRKLKGAQFAVIHLINMLKEGMDSPAADKARRKWGAKTYTLEDILGDENLDKRTEFGIFLTIENVSGSEKEEEEEDEANCGMKLDQLEKISSSGESPQEHTNIWEQHALHMQQRYLATGLPNFAIETKLAFQKKAFDTHLNRESQLRKAYEDTANLPLDCIRKGVASTWNTVLVTTQFSEHSMWELSSTQLWRYFSGGISWNLPQWVPRGILRIETMSSSSRIFFDFGARIFSTRHVNLPSTCSTHSFFTHAKCHETGADVTFGIAFLAGGFVEVHFPAEVIVKPDSGCNIDTIVETVVGLTGVYVGPVA